MKIHECTECKELRHKKDMAPGHVEYAHQSAWLCSECYAAALQERRNEVSSGLAGKGWG